MVGSSQSVAGPNIALNTIMAEELGKFADELENAQDFEAALQKLVSRTFQEHQRIIFNGNGYSKQWEEEALSRGLSNLPTTADALSAYLSEKNISLVTKHNIFTEEEFRARYDIYMDSYRKMVSIEGRTTVDMVLHQILPAAISYTNTLCQTVNAKNQIGASHIAESALIESLSQATDRLYIKCMDLQKALNKIPEDVQLGVAYCKDVIIAQMNSLRANADELESLTDKSYWPYPTYSDLLFY